LANEAGNERRDKEEAEDGRGIQAGAGETAVGHRIVTIAGREIVGRSGEATTHQWKSLLGLEARHVAGRRGVRKRRPRIKPCY
jgi:hypothetical protein